MLFQAFDDKKECSMIYKSGKFHNNHTANCTRTWSYAPYLENQEIEYANLFALGKSLEELCPSNKLAQFKEVQKKLKSVVKASQAVGLNSDQICIYDVLPRYLLKEWAEVKNTICEAVFNDYPKPKNYEQLMEITKVITDIKYRPLKLDLSQIDRITIQDKNTYKLISENKPIIDYDISKTITGRLSTKQYSFPVMTLAKKYRKVLIPNNSWLFEMDFNACELRVALALLGHAQPEEDLHDWNLKHVFTRAKSRDNAKKRVFSWLYNPNSKDDAISKVYDREKLKTLYFKDNKVTTPYGREIECDEDHAISYLIQSTAADMVFEQMYKVWEFLKDRKSFIKFCNHDSVMIDLHTEQEYEFHPIKELFGDTRFGKFKVNCLGGKNWADMKDLYIK
jgi:hypothetical protein